MYSLGQNTGTEDVSMTAIAGEHSRRLRTGHAGRRIIIGRQVVTEHKWTQHIRITTVIRQPTRRQHVWTENVRRP
jgi:hypothetical protein